MIDGVGFAGALAGLTFLIGYLNTAAGIAFCTTALLTIILVGIVSVRSRYLDD